MAKPCGQGLRAAEAWSLAVAAAAGPHYPAPAAAATAKLQASAALNPWPHVLRHTKTQPNFVPTRRPKMHGKNV